MGHIVNLVRWEWFKLYKRWMPWILLAILLAFTQLYLWGNFASRSTGGGGHGFAAFTLPGSLSGTLFVAHSIGAVLIIILSASVIGTEYGWGTLRGIMVRGTGRWQHLAGKLLLLSTVAAAALVITVAVTSLSSLLAGALAGEAPTTWGPSPGWGDGAVTLAKAWMGLIPYVALAAIVTILTSSSAAGIGLGLGYYFVEQIAVTILIYLFGWFETVADYLLGYNVTAWMLSSQLGDGGGIFANDTDISSYPGELHALIVISVYTLAMCAFALWIFRRKDIGGVKGG
ncbi:ABC transporter permease subunit [Chloroflexota bacterium]